MTCFLFELLQYLLVNLTRYLLLFINFRAEARCQPGQDQPHDDCQLCWDISWDVPLSVYTVNTVVTNEFQSKDALWPALALLLALPRYQHLHKSTTIIYADPFNGEKSGNFCSFSPNFCHLKRWPTIVGMNWSIFVNTTREIFRTRTIKWASLG